MDLEARLRARPSRRGDLGAWYSQLLEAAGREGMSIPELAGRLGCSPETVYSWRRRLTRKAGGDTGGPSTGLVRVRVTEPEAEPDSDGTFLEVCTRGGRSVRVAPGFDPSTLAAVVAVLEQC